MLHIMISNTHKECAFFSKKEKKSAFLVVDGMNYTCSLQGIDVAWHLVAVGLMKKGW